MSYPATLPPDGELALLDFEPLAMAGPGSAAPCPAGWATVRLGGRFARLIAWDQGSTIEVDWLAFRFESGRKLWRGVATWDKGSGRFIGARLPGCSRWRGYKPAILVDFCEGAVLVPRPRPKLRLVSGGRARPM